MWKGQETATVYLKLLESRKPSNLGATAAATHAQNIYHNLGWIHIHRCIPWVEDHLYPWFISLNESGNALDSIAVLRFVISESFMKHILLWLIPVTQERIQACDPSHKDRAMRKPRGWKHMLPWMNYMSLESNEDMLRYGKLLRTAVFVFKEKCQIQSKNGDVSFSFPVSAVSCGWCVL